MKALSTAQWLLLAKAALLVAEIVAVRLLLVRGRYTLKDTLASLGMRAGNYASNLLLAGATVAAFAACYQYHWLDISITSPWAWVALVVLDDFAY